jgi:hypothetical protein
MRIYIVGTVMSVSEPTMVKLPKGPEIPKATIAVRTRDEATDAYIAIDAFGEEKIQRLSEAQVSGLPVEMVVTISSRIWTNDEGKTGYNTFLNLKHLLGTMK